MSVAAIDLGRLWAPPGYADAGARMLLTRAAEAHAHLLQSLVRECEALREALAPLLAFLGGPFSDSEKRQLLLHPLFIEGLHGLAQLSPTLRQWHETVTATYCVDEDGDVLLASLGHVSLTARLRFDRGWCGEHVCCTDVLGQLGFPLCDWTLRLADDGRNFLPRRLVALVLDERQASWYLADLPERPFLVLARDDWVHMLVAGGNLSPGSARFPHPRVRPSLQRATPLGRSGIRYDPTAFQHYDAHAGLTGGLIRTLVTALQRHSPSIYRELCRFIHTVRGFEFPTLERGTVGSFSDPTLPGVVGVNIAYSPHHRPCLDPFCFTWLGHEMGHTKNYLIDTILFTEGQVLLTNAAEQTGVLPRYGRSFSVRTLFQIPYVHLYEWTLLMDFYQGSFAGLPWTIPDGVDVVGNDFAAEIAEAFDGIAAKARLTPLGEAALNHFRHLAEETDERWRSLGFRK